jgi:c-di-GMP-binding flagellar brake protein YcgR
MKREEEKVKSRYGTVNFEKRKHPRFDVNLPIEYARSDLVASHGEALNVSEGGLLLYLPERMEIGQHLSLKLFFSSDSELKTIKTLVKVAWTDIHLGESRGDYRAGVKFVEISPEDLERLRSFLRSLSGDMT